MYSVSNLGRIKSHLAYQGRTVDHILTPYPVRDGYLKVDFTGSRKNARRTFYVARLVMIAFVGTQPDQSQVNHKNGKTSDNRLDNLEWCSASQNILHSYRTLGRKPIVIRGEQNTSSKLTDEKVREFRKLQGQGISIREITRRSGLDRRSIQMMLRRVTWCHVE